MATAIAEFLSARYDEEAAAAESIDTVTAQTAMWAEPVHFSRWNPRKVEAMLRALRLVVAMHGECHGPCETLRALAGVYRGHADYDPAWALQPDQVVANSMSSRDT